jgi:lysophospholipase
MTPVAVAPSSRAAPGPLAPTESVRFCSADGTDLYGEWFAAHEPRASALLMHGYAEHAGRYREVAHVLHRLGVSALSYDMRGHGRSGGQRGYIDGFRDYLDDMDAALAELHERIPDRALPRLLVAHSNGALVALRALADPARKPEITAAVLSSPFLRLKMAVPVPQQMLGRAASRWAPRLTQPNKIPLEHLTSDPAKQAERRSDPLCHDVASARWFTAAEEAQAYVADYASRIDVPTLWLVAHDDRLVDPAASRVVRARLRAPSVYHGLIGMQHEVFNERDRDRVFHLLEESVESFLAMR